MLRRCYYSGKASGGKSRAEWKVFSLNVSMPRYDYKAFSSALGQRVKELRKARGWTLRDMIVKHGLHLNQVSRIESGKGVSVPTLLRLAEIFQVPIEVLIARLGEVRTTGSKRLRK